jgi:hypothetical protein
VKTSEAIDRYKFGYLSQNDIFKQKKYCTHAIYRKPGVLENTNNKIYAILSAIFLISVLILTFGCVEQFIVFFGSLVFSFFFRNFLKE